MSADRPGPAAHSARRRAELVNAAYALVTSRGYRTIGVDDIASLAGVSHGTFYNYFANKRDILDAVIDHCFAVIRERLMGDEPTPATLDEFRARYGRIVDRCYDLVASEPGLVNFLLLEASSIDDRVLDRIMRNAQTDGDTAAREMEYGIAHGYLDDRLDTRVGGEVLVSVLMSALLTAVQGERHGLTRDRVRTQLTDFLATALGAEAAGLGAEVAGPEAEAAGPEAHTTGLEVETTVRKAGRLEVETAGLGAKTAGLEGETAGLGAESAGP
ncbi:TetR/AcrR family transcriptional regulator [Nocardia otitidiscaviarum]|uniref:TetR/AcrR family transcriptional regulator n=1 Tax=Nocardia otitidiscaviarum TaxID=1823 RepID=A0A516NJZ7_9NOCA|nr:TetR/AcrR family transcriptional regulator [Nocardia otitidiscaviarum]MCP9619398.1 TetR/AcrR family transcriptional regulator [Nocardia otitidiscaviarum]QDP79224.1 TetR/AcrR family transcriptional regulator [Nocardia otitidiscaviarum]